MNKLMIREKHKQLKAMLAVSLIGYWPFGILLGLFTPDNILDYGWARTLTDFVAGLIPFVSRVGIHTPVLATKFIAAVMHILALWCAVLLAYYLLRNDWKTPISRFKAMSKKRRFYILFVGPIIVSAPYFLFFQMPKSSSLPWKFIAMMSSKTAMGIYGSVVIAGWILAAMSAMALIMVVSSWCREDGRR